MTEREQTKKNELDMLDIHIHLSMDNFFFFFFLADENPAVDVF